MKSKILTCLTLVAGFFLCAFGFSLSDANAETGTSTLSVSPMNQTLILTPGETYEGTIRVSNPNDATSNLEYSVSVGSFSQDYNEATGDDYGSVNIENTSNYNQIMDWITVNNSTGSVAPNNTEAISFTINVPYNAPAGGQYATLLVMDNTELNSEENKGFVVKEGRQVASIIYAEVAGETIESGEITDNYVPSFVLGGSLETTSMVRNNGNIHTDAEYTLQVWPLFSDEEIYTNEEDPTKSLIMPETNKYTVQKMENTPFFGIYRVKQTVKIFGEEKIVEKNVVICPIWLLFVIIFAVIVLVVWLVLKSKNRKKSNR
jgi:hypothetical protein